MELLVTIIILALIFDYINGFHDAANSIATIVSTKVLTPFQAVLWAAFFNFVAFFIAKYIIGSFGIANTVSKTVVEQYITLPIILAGIIAAISWNLITWWKGIPSSSSHTLIGGFAGAAIMANGFEAIQLNIILKIAAFIFLVPIVFTIFHPPDIVPSEIAVKQENATQSGRSEILFIPIPRPIEWAAIIAAAMIPITFCESFRPCPTLNMAEETNCNLLNHISAVCGFVRRQI